MKRLMKVLDRWLRPVEEDNPVDAFLEHGEALERHLNNVAVSLGRLKGNERHLRFELEAALAKVEATENRLRSLADQDEVSRQHLGSMQRRNQQEAIELGRRLEEIEAKKKPIEEAYDELRSVVREALDRRDVLMARVDAAEARDAVYGDVSGVETENGASRIEIVLEHVRRLEAKAEATVELFSLGTASGIPGGPSSRDGGDRSP